MLLSVVRLSLMLTALAVCDLAFPASNAATDPARLVPACSISWTQVPSPNPSMNGKDVNLYGVAAISDDDVWAVGYWTDGYQHYRPLTMHFDGQRWKPVQSAPVGPTDGGTFFGVAGTSSSDVWVVGRSDDTYESIIEHWDGTAWSLVPFSSRIGTLEAVVALSPTNAWAVGGWVASSRRSYPLVMHWDGKRWIHVGIERPGAPSWFYGIEAIDPNEIWAVGGVKALKEPGQTLIEHWDGTSWQITASPSTATDVRDLNVLLSVSGASNAVWAVGAPIPSYLVEHWDGARWRLQKVPAPATFQNLLFGVLARSPNDVWAAGQGENMQPPFGGLILEHWDGTRWQLAHFERGRNSFVYDLDATPSGTIWGVGGFGNADFGSSATYTARICPGQVTDEGITPEVADANFHMPSEWRFDPSNTSAHEVSDATGLALFDSEPRGAGGSFVYRFPAAGSYAVIDQTSGHVQTVQVPLVVSPKSGNGTRSFHLRWASYGSASGRLFDIQIERPGDASSSSWRRGVTATAGSFIPDAGPGTYAFRARVRNPSTGARCEWSPIAEITVTP
jgi:hypothetical protein